ncbi:MAG: hypothetical protein QFB87_00620 [Patescibacteria group bacterium]|nr:hypothetical protein [Patescibacteria group bacterium]
MSNSNKGAANVALSAVLLVVGLAVGFGVSKASDNKDTSSTTKNSATAPTSGTKAADIRANLVSLGVQHQDLTMHAVDAALDGDKNAAEVGKDLYKNGTDIGAAVGSIYGKDAETTFNTVWKLHLDQFVNYAVASSKGDDAGKKAALSTIDTQYTHPLSAYLAKANPNLPEDTLYSVLSDHVTQTAQMIDLHVKGDFAGETAARDQAAQHLNGIFSTLAGGIVKQFPDKFQN